MMGSREVPESWRLATLGDACSIERGITFPASAKQTASKSENIACLRTSNVQERVDWDDLIFVDRSFVKGPNKLLQAGDVLISLANSASLVGKVAFVDRVETESTFGGFISVIRPSSLLDSYFLFAFLSSETTQAMLRSWASQTTNIGMCQ